MFSEAMWLSRRSRGGEFSVVVLFSLSELWTKKGSESVFYRLQVIAFKTSMSEYESVAESVVANIEASIVFREQIQIGRLRS